MHRGREAPMEFERTGPPLQNSFFGSNLDQNSQVQNQPTFTSIFSRSQTLPQTTLLTQLHAKSSIVEDPIDIDIKPEFNFNFGSHTPIPVSVDNRKNEMKNNGFQRNTAVSILSDKLDGTTIRDEHTEISENLNMVLAKRKRKKLDAEGHFIHHHHHHLHRSEIANSAESESAVWSEFKSHSDSRGRWQPN
ncbi:hypothetical protein HK096_001470, partial [Nowakowskiella sp. JEL0078]